MAQDDWNPQPVSASEQQYVDTGKTPTDTGGAYASNPAPSAPAMTSDRWKVLNADPAYENSILSRLFTTHSKTEGHSYGNGSLGNDFSKNVLQDPAYAAQFKRQAGETFDRWINRLEGTFPGIKNSAHTAGLFDDADVQHYFSFDTTPGANGLTPAQQEEATRRAQEEQTMTQIRDFANNLLKPLDASDPEVQQIMQSASNAAEKMARRQGIQGPMSVGNAEGSMQSTLTGYNADRQNRGFSALQYKHQAELGQGQQLDAAARSKWEADAGMAKQRADQSPLPMALGIGGAAIGGVAGFFAGGPAGAIGGAGAGFGVGSGIGKYASQPSYAPPPVSRYRGSY